MKKSIIVLAAAVILMTIAFAIQTQAASPAVMASQRILMFDNMVGVDGPFVGDANPIRGINGDDLPWEITHYIRGSLMADGRLMITVWGLVFPDDPSVPPELRGKNDEDHFRAVVSCLTDDGAGGVETVNVTTAGFPATMTGYARIKTTVTLPDPCVAPIIFVIAGSEDKWFAVTGAESP